MQKLKLQSSETVNAPASEQVVVRISFQSGSFVARYFQPEDAPVLAEGQTTEIQVLDSIPAFDANAFTGLRTIPATMDRYTASSVTTSTAFDGKVFKEIGAQVIKPLNSNAYGAGERGDFSAIVLSFGTEGEVREPYNHYADSVGSRGSLARSARLRNAVALFALYTPSQNLGFESSTLLHTNVGGFVIEDATDGQWADAPAGTTLYSLLPTVSLTCNSIAADGAATVNVSVSNGYTGELVVESVSGYAPHSRVSVSNGAGAFKFMALGLSAGETARVKVGSKNISGLADLSIPVV
jgi:hypothetical protein